MEWNSNEWTRRSSIERKDLIKSVQGVVKKIFVTNETLSDEGCWLTAWKFNFPFRMLHWWTAVPLLELLGIHGYISRHFKTFESVQIPVTYDEFFFFLYIIASPRPATIINPTKRSFLFSLRLTHTQIHTPVNHPMEKCVSDCKLTGS